MPLRFSHLRCVAWLFFVLLAGTAQAATPDWVTGGGASPRFPHQYYLTGYGVADVRDGRTEDAVRLARNDASAAVASAVRVKIEQTLTSVEAVDAQGARAEVSAVTHSAANAQVTGLVYETVVENGKAHVLAILERIPAATDHRHQRDRLVSEAQKHIAEAVEAEQTLETAAATRSYYSARFQLLAAEGEDSIAQALSSDQSPVAATAAQLRRNVENRIEKLFKGGQGSLDDAIAMLALQLRQQGVGREATLKVTPLEDGSNRFSSPLGQAISSGLEAALARVEAEVDSGSKPIQGGVSLSGNYIDGDVVRITVMAREEGSGRALASAKVSVPAAALPAGLGRHAPNASAARADSTLLSASQEGGDLRLDVWTQRGPGPLTLRRGDRVSLFFRVNRPAWVRLTYILANGQRALLEQRFRIEGANVNKPVQYPTAFSVTPPLGVEQLYAVAFTSEPPPLKTKRLTVEEGDYEIVETVQQLVAHRGLTAVASDAEGAKVQSAEALLTMTTLE